MVVTQCKWPHLTALVYEVVYYLDRLIKKCVVLFFVLFAAPLDWRKRGFYIRFVGARGDKKCWWIGQPRHRRWREYETHKYESKVAEMEWHPWPFLKVACACDRWFTQIHKQILLSPQGHKTFGVMRKWGLKSRADKLSVRTGQPRLRIQGPRIQKDRKSVV